MNAVLNVSGYVFAGIDDPHALRDLLVAAARDRGIRGTILLAREGINLVLAGEQQAVDSLLETIRSRDGLGSLQVKRSWSDAQPFRKLLVKVKPEIIRMNQPAVAPQDGRAPALDAATLKRWLDQGHDDQGRPLLLLDTRNAFEVDYGTFEGALDWRLSRFSEFPGALDTHRDQLRDRTVVTFCTGGIRCEKAALWMRESGVQDVWQLEGGILNYFEQQGSAHWRGSCFVFDEREALDPGLAPVRS